MSIILRSNVAYTGSVTDLPIQPLLLSSIQSAAAFSLRQLSSIYAGAAVLVRRSSDNAEANIGFASGALDEAALTAFVGAGDGFVKTWYDQSGNAFNATQADSTKQAKIVSAGAVIKKNSKPSVLFDGSNDFYSFAAPDIFRNISAGYILSVWSTNNPVDGTADGDIAVALGHAGGSNRATLAIEPTPPGGAAADGTMSISARRLDADAVTNANNSALTTTPGTLLLQTGRFLFSAGTIGVAKNNSQFYDAALPSSGNSANTAATANYIGWGVNQFNTAQWNGHISEVLVFNTDQAANLAYIRSDVMSYHGIA